jgi:hypothetical protein
MTKGQLVKKKLLVEFVLKDEKLPSIYKSPQPARSLIPDWYKSASAHIDKEEFKILSGGKRNGTYKKCVPFMDAITSGYVITLPADVMVTKNDKGEQVFQWIVDGNIVALHDKKEHPGFPIPKNYSNRVFTWIGQYIVKTPKGYSCLFTHPLNNYGLPFRVLSGVVDTDNYGMPVDSPFMIEKDFTGIIPEGTPICQVIPFKRNNWISVRKVANKKELENWINFYFRKMVSAYKASVWSRKSYE